MEYVRQGDTVVVESISRFARIQKTCWSLVDELKNKGVAFVSHQREYRHQHTARAIHADRIRRACAIGT